MDAERILHDIEYLKTIKHLYPETVDEVAHNSVIKGLWELYAAEAEKEDTWK
ncbi:hypothetical protein KAR91_79095 [Candidatus Pacearchaeota archaeon]|nr:hypothetical protein [Candidatus Pacearchaeota archaeon]